MQQTKFIDDHKVKYDDADHHVHRGIYHLDELHHEESQALFEAAHRDGEAVFHNSEGYAFALVYQHDDEGRGQYLLIPKAHA